MKIILLLITLILSLSLQGCEEKNLEVKVEYLNQDVNNYSIKFIFNKKIDSYNTEFYVYYKDHLVGRIPLMNCYSEKRERKKDYCILTKFWFTLKEGNYTFKIYDRSKKEFYNVTIPIELKGSLKTPLKTNYTFSEYEPINLTGKFERMFFYKEIKDSIYILNYTKEYYSCINNCSLQNKGKECQEKCKSFIKKQKLEGKFVLIHYGKWFKKEELKDKKEMLKICELNRNISKDIIEETFAQAAYLGFYCPVSATTGVITTLATEGLTMYLQTLSSTLKIFEGLFKAAFALFGFGRGYEYVLVTDFNNYYEPLRYSLAQENKAYLVFKIKEYEEPKYLIVKETATAFFFFSKSKELFAVDLR